MGRGPKLENRRKGAAGSGRERKRKKQFNERTKKDNQDVLALLDKKQKKRLNHEKAQGKTGESTGFEQSIVSKDTMDAIPFKKNFWRGPPAPPGEPDDDLKMLRKSIGVKVKGAACPPPVLSFSDSSLSKHFSDFKSFCSGRSGAAGRVEKPTPIQAQVWPVLLCGLDVIGIAPTGSGKTLAYLLPVVPHILGQEADVAQQKGPQCLVVMPTRELAKQVCDVCGSSSGGGGWLKRLFNLRAGAVYGGIGKEEQLDNIMTIGPPNILCATPGRLLDLMGLGVLSMERVTYLVLDEADRMLALGFEVQLTAIIKSIRPNRQALLFSATFPGKLREAAEQWMAADRVVVRVGAVELTSGGPSAKAKETANDKREGKTECVPRSISAAEPKADAANRDTGGKEEADQEGGKDATFQSTLTVSSTIHQTVHVCAQHKKERKLLQFLTKIRAQEKTSGVRQRAAILIFCKEIKNLKSVTKLVEKHGERAAPLHSGIPQAKREEALDSLKSGKVDTVVATDVASRGLHITRLRHVVNYDFPGNLEQYCHRIGRVGRQGVDGWSYSFFTRSLSPMAAGLIALLERCKQAVDPNLKALAVEHRDGAGASKSAKEDDGNEDDDDGDEDDGEEPRKGNVDEDVPVALDENDEEEASDADESSSEVAAAGPGRGGGIRIKPMRKRKHNAVSSDSDAEPEGNAPATIQTVAQSEPIGKKKKKQQKKKRRGVQSAELVDFGKAGRKGKAGKKGKKRR